MAKLSKFLKPGTDTCDTVIVAYLAYASKRSYRDMARSLIDYVKHAEERSGEEQAATS